MLTVMGETRRRPEQLDKGGALPHLNTQTPTGGDVTQRSDPKPASPKAPTVG